MDPLSPPCARGWSRGYHLSAHSGLAGTTWLRLPAGVWSRRAQITHEVGLLRPTASASLVTQEPPRRARLQRLFLRAQIGDDAGCPLGLKKRRSWFSEDHLAAPTHEGGRHVPRSRAKTIAPGPPWRQS